MTVRGAPAIAVAAALSLSVELSDSLEEIDSGHATEVVALTIEKRLDYLVTSRPTAVNLSDAAGKLKATAERASGAAGATGVSVAETVIAACEQMLREDVAANKTLGAHGSHAILAEVEKRRKQSTDTSRGLRILTHCNTGSLATAGYGTALGVVRALHASGRLQHVYCTETRPYNQGSRLTAFELVHDGIPATLIADSAVAALMMTEQIHAVVVGADRVAANGDTANKIGTLQIATIANSRGVPFYVAAPTTTLDANLADGTLITIEQRDATELTHHQGIHVAAPGINVWNPAFDVTDSALITGIITERGLVPSSTKKNRTFDIPAFLRAQKDSSETDALQNGHAAADLPQSSIPGFYALDLESVKRYLADRPALAERVGPPGTEAAWQVREVGDGNINYVYIVEGLAGALVVKQGLPYIRIAHDWPLTQDRARIEAMALAEQARHCPEHVPALYHFDETLALIVMQYLPPPHDILRRALTAGAVFPQLSYDVATFLARTLFHTSLLALDTKTWREKVAAFRNGDLCRLTEQVIFTDPYHEARVNRHTSPQLDAFALSLREDADAKAAAMRLKACFCERQQALLHGDLHTGSFMVTAETTYAIDAEFATYGPIAFDVCKMIANLFIAYFASFGLESSKSPRDHQRKWLLQSILEIWDRFETEFLGLWSAAVAGGSSGDLAPAALFGGDAPFGPQALEDYQAAFMREVFVDMLGFTGAVILRRIFGIAHVIDFESIADPDVRARCELRAAVFGLELLKEASNFEDMDDVFLAAEDV